MRGETHWGSGACAGWTLWGVKCATSFLETRRDCPGMTICRFVPRAPIFNVLRARFEVRKGLRSGSLLFSVWFFCGNGYDESPFWATWQGRSPAPRSFSMLRQILSVLVLLL